MSAVFSDSSGGGERFLAVADSGSDDVMIFRVSSDGAIPDVASQVIALGQSPTLLVSMEWMRQPALATLDSNDNAISLVTGLGEPNPIVRTIGSGGVDPVAAEYFDVGGSTGLVVANSGDGSVAAFLESPSGLTMSSRFFSPRPHGRAGSPTLWE